MAERLSKKLMRTSPSLGDKTGINGAELYHWCPGCNMIHSVSIEVPNSRGALWSWNGDIQNPTISPSNLYDKHPPRCHYFLRNGKIQFLQDCSHSLANQTVDLPDLPDWV